MKRFYILRSEKCGLTAPLENFSVTMEPEPKDDKEREKRRAKRKAKR
jgi:hypothetical protein